MLTGCTGRRTCCSRGAIVGALLVGWRSLRISYVVYAACTFAILFTFAYAPRPFLGSPTLRGGDVSRVLDPGSEASISCIRRRDGHIRRRLRDRGRRLHEPGVPLLRTVTRRDPALAPNSGFLVGAGGFEPPTSSVSGKRSPPELSARCKDCISALVATRGGDRNRTGVRGFAGPCLTTRPPRRNA